MTVWACVDSFGTGDCLGLYGLEAQVLWAAI
jgi:hypothetical protein